jgi:hypothetical protein|tara:strand:- start:33 stop:1169 length:1137 start_codon:yes stop_codon:yes gene_type:complete
MEQFDKFKNDIISYGHQLLRIFGSMHFDFSSLDSDFKISWRIEIKIQANHDGDGSPFEIVPVNHYSVEGLPSHLQENELISFGIESYLSSVWKRWQATASSNEAVGWSGGSIFGKIRVIPAVYNSDHQIQTTVDLRQGLEEKTVAILLIKNCEHTIEKVLESIRRTSDYQLVLDDNSTDTTPAIVESLRGSYPGLILRKEIMGMSASADYIRPLLNTRTTVWKVDGDEFWGPHHIPIIKKIIQSNEWKNSTELKMQNCNIDIMNIDLESDSASGNLGTKSLFFNFANIISWDQPNERLHGAQRSWRPGTGVLEVEDTGILMAHFPSLNMSSIDKNSVSINRDVFKKDRYESKNIDNPEDSETISLSHFDCLNEIKKAK